MNPRIRCQGAILREHHILLIKHREHATGRSYWLLPGGGLEPGESEEACVRREMREETHLDVRVERLLLDNKAKSSDVYDYFKTYLCEIAGGDPRPGHEPEVEAAALYAITEIAWFDLRDSSGWGADIIDNPITAAVLQNIQAALGYTSGSG